MHTDVSEHVLGSIIITKYDQNDIKYMLLGMSSILRIKEACLPSAIISLRQHM